MTQTQMTEMTVVSFETVPHGTVHLSELSEGPPFTVHGVALGDGDVTVGQSGIKKKWPADELQKAADSLRGTNLVVDHDNNATGVVGRVTKSGYKEGTGVIYEAELFDQDLAEKIKNGLLEVSIRGYHADVDSLEEDEETEALLVEDITFDNLSIVPTGASPSNTLEMGEHAELSAAELRQFAGTLNKEELQEEIEAGTWVKWGDNRGITISMPEDGEVEVDIYEERDDKWRSIGETEMVSVGDLDEWDVDEEQVGEAADEEDDSEEDEESEEEAAAVEEGQFVKWKGVDNDWKYGKIIGMKQEGQQMVANLRRFTKEGDPLDMTEQKPVQGLDRWDRAPNENKGDMQSNGLDAPEWNEGEMVQWQVNPDMKGKIVHVADEEGSLMIEVMETEGGEMVSSGHTVKAGFSDVVPVDGEQAVTTRDMPVQDAEPEHEPMGDDKTLIDLFKEFMSSMEMEEPTLVDFHDWSEEQLYDIERGEGEEQPYRSQKEKEIGQEDQPERYPEDADPEELERFDDYPEAAKKNAQMALDAREETGNPNDCGTDVGWKRANQLANGEGVTREQVGKMAAFNRHRQNSEQSEEEGRADCGWMMWKAWGGDEGVDWAQRKMEQIEEENSDELAFDDVPDEHLFKTKADAVEKARDVGIEPVGAHEMNGRWIPGETHEDYMDQVASQSGHGDMEEDEEEMGTHGKEMMEAFKMASEMVTKFVSQEEMDQSSLVSDFADWADDEMVDMAVEAFVSEENFSMESQVSDFESWLDSQMAEPDDEAEASADEGDVSDVEELQDYERHTPDWSGTTESDWSSPDMEDFDTDDLSEIDNHFLISATGFPPENFTDLKLPVVEPNGDLNVNALAAVKGGRGVSAVDGLSSDMEEKIVNWVNKTANEEFDKNWGEDEEENSGEAEAHEIDGTAGRPTPASQKRLGGVRVLSGDDLRDGSSGASDVDSLATYKVTTDMNTEIEEKLSELDEPVAVEATDIEELREKADRFDEMSDNLEALRERTDILDSVDRSQVEELAEAEEAVVVESGRLEELEAEAEQVKGVYAAQLAEKYPLFTAEELSEKYDLSELREKFEEEIGSVEEELAAGSDEAEPKSQDPSEEELEEQSSDEEKAEEELEDAVSAKQEEIRNKILGGN